METITVIILGTEIDVTLDGARVYVEVINPGAIDSFRASFEANTYADTIETGRRFRELGSDGHENAPEGRWRVALALAWEALIDVTSRAEYSARYAFEE